MTTNTRYAGMVLVAASLGLAAGAGAQAPAGYGGGMMGGGMMGGGYGMMARPAQAPPAGEGGQVDAARARALLGYLRDQRLACLQCHAVDSAGFGPPFAQIAEYYAGRPGAQRVLQRAIVQGVGRMPGGLASPAQAAELGRLILQLGAS